jgi:alpha-1,6-mannosyltransferase
LAGKASVGDWRARQLFGAALQSPLVLLAGLVALNAAVYWLLFVRPWSLTDLYQSPLLDLRRISAGDPLARWRLLAGFGLLGLVYWLGWRAAQRAQGRAGWVLVLAGAATSGAILLFLYPFDAADLFDNIMHGRILGVYGANPFTQVAAEFKADPFYRYVGWQRFTSAYGPGWELIAAPIARLAGDGIVANVLAFKALGALALAGCIAIVSVLLRRTAPERALAGTLLLAWNPLVLYETLGQGHNDVVMLLWVLACVGFLARSRYTLAILALVTGALFKFVPLLLLPAAGLISLRALPRARARLRFAAVTACAAVIFVVLAYAPFWRGPETLGLELRRELFTTSLPAVTYALLHGPLGKERAASAVSLVAAAITALFALWQGVRASRDPSWQSFVQAAFAILMFYLLFTCLWFQQWYAVWLLGLVPLLPAGHLAWLGVSFSFAVLAKPLIFEPIWLWPHPQPDRSWLELRLGPAVLALPWMLALLALWMGWRARSPRRRLISESGRDSGV